MTARPRVLPFTPVPDDLGRKLTAEQVAAEVLEGLKPASWVRRYMRSPEAGYTRLGHSTVFWYEHVAEAWVRGHWRA